MRRFVALHIPAASCINCIDGHTKPNHTIDAPFSMPVELIIALLGSDLVPQEACCFRVCMSNERLFLREFELEALFQKLLQLPFDVLCFGFWSGKPKEGIICIAYVAESPVVGIDGIANR